MFATTDLPGGFAVEEPRIVLVAARIAWCYELAHVGIIPSCRRGGRCREDLDPDDGEKSSVGKGSWLLKDVLFDVRWEYIG